MWLIRAMLVEPTETKNWDTSVMENILQGNEISLDDMTEFRNSEKTVPSQSTESEAIDLDLLLSTAQRPQESAEGNEAANSRPLGEIWQSVGSMILEAADLPDAEGRNIISFVREVIAHIHHIGLVPENLYAYAPPEDSIAVHQPPMIHLLSSRILNALSDAQWRAHEKEVIEQAAVAGAKWSFRGHELPGARYKLKVRDLGPEVWLEFVLWSCLGSGYVEEATWILAQMQKRKGDHQWSVLNWQAVEDSALVDWDRVAYRTGGVVGRIEGYSNEKPFVEMGNRTISSEVVTASIDGLVNMTRVGVGVRGLPVTFILKRIVVLKDILDRDQFGLGSNSWNSIIARLAGSGGIDIGADPETMERILGLAPVYRKELGLRKGEKDVPFSRNLASNLPFAHDTAMPLGLLHRCIIAHAQNGNLHGAMRTFLKLVTYVDDNRQRSIDDFAKALKNEPREEGWGTFQEGGTLTVTKPGTQPEIPVPVLASLLNAATEARAFEFGRWLLYSEDVDGPYIQSYLYKASNMVPAILSFAAASSDFDLMAKVFAADPPRTRSVERALLSCEIVLNRWGRVQEIFEASAGDIESCWGALDAMRLAVAVLRLESTASSLGASPNERRYYTQAQRIFANLLAGHYDSPQPLAPQRTPDTFQEGLRKQLHSLFSSIPHGSAWLSTNISQATMESLDRNIAVKPLPTEAFNIFLTGAVDMHGSAEGKRLWDIFCEDIDVIERQRIEGGVLRLSTSNELQDTTLNEALKRLYKRNPSPIPSTSTKMVRPNLRTARILVQAALQEGEQLGRVRRMRGRGFKSVLRSQRRGSPLSNPRKEQIDQVLEWGADTLRVFGLKDHEIDLELEGWLSKKNKRIDNENPLKRDVVIDYDARLESALNGPPLGA